MTVERFIENGGNPEISSKLFEKLAPKPVLGNLGENIQGERYKGQGDDIKTAREAVEEAFTNIELSNN